MTDKSRAKKIRVHAHVSDQAIANLVEELARKEGHAIAEPTDVEPPEVDLYINRGVVGEIDETLRAADAIALAAGLGENDFFVIANAQDGSDTRRLHHVNRNSKTAESIELPNGLAPSCLESSANGQLLAIGCDSALLIAQHHLS